MRSGTTYLFRYLWWLSNGKALFEPLNDIGMIWRTFPQLRKIQIRYDPKMLDVLMRTHYIYDYDLLRQYFENLKDWNIKEVVLHFYLNEYFIRDNWDVYHIIRNPADIMLSYINAFLRPLKLHKIYILLRLLDHIPFLNILSYNMKSKYLWFREAKFFERFIHTPETHPFKIKTFEDAITIVWTITNYYAINSINPDKQLIIYEKPETYYKLPRWEEWLEKEPLKIKKYKQRDRIFRKMYESAKKFGIEKEFKELMSFFD